MRGSNSNKWKCCKCHNMNYMDRKECWTFGCDEWRPRGLIPKRSAEPSPRNLARKRSDWHCCGETQFGSRSSCRKCKRTRISIEPMNRLHNTLEETNNQSDIANTKSLTIFRPGDWMCPACNDHQFANRLRCRDCETSRPVKEDKDGNDIGNPCVVCYENERNSAFLHGKDAHFVCCRECAVKMDQCPMCRKAVDEIINIF